MSTSGSGTTWLSLRDEKKHNIKEHFGQGYRVPEGINSGRTFRVALETFSSKEGERRVERLEAKLGPSYIPITELAKAVDKSTADLQHLAANETLEGLIWWISFALIEVHGLIPSPYMADYSIVRVQSWSSADSSRNSDS